MDRPCRQVITTERRITLYLLLTLLSTVCLAQPADSVPAPSNVLNAPYPRIYPDLRVTFRVNAPQASKVQIAPSGNANGLGRGPFDMVKDDKGVWTVTTPPARPGFHYYTLLVDGYPANDPSSETYFGWAKQTSGLEVPDKTIDFYDIKDVPHGDVRTHWYKSKVTAAWRRAFVYTPPEYDVNPRKRFPVLYLQHGSGESERGWTMQGRANFILDNLIASGIAVPMILVMDNGYASKPGDPPSSRGNAAFPEVVVHDLLPGIEAKYRAIPDRDHRAIAGLSMGAGQAMQTGFANLDRFAYIGAFSGVMRNFDLNATYNGIFSDPAALNKKVRLFWMGFGDLEGDLFTAGKSVHSQLDRAKVRHVWFETGGSHEWQVWRKSLYDFAPRLFKH
ncbi:MAG: esterase [Acidobacteria bacterium]|nr:esterase [Acidobacteriota bacterium]